MLCVHRKFSSLWSQITISGENNEMAGSRISYRLVQDYETGETCIPDPAFHLLEKLIEPPPSVLRLFFVYLFVRLILEKGFLCLEPVKELALGD